MSRTRYRREGRRRRIRWAFTVAAVGLVAVPLTAHAAIEAATDGPAFTLTNLCGAVRLDAGAPAEPAGAALRVAAPVEGERQRWRIDTAQDGLSTVASLVDDRLLDAEGGGTAPGTKAIVWPSNDGGNQRWRVRTGADAVTTLEAGYAPGLLLAVRDGTAVLLPEGNPCTGWTLAEVGSAPSESAPSAASAPPAAAPSSPVTPTAPDHSHHTEASATATPGGTTPASPGGTPASTPTDATVSAGGTLRNHAPGSGMAATLTIPPGHPGFDESRVRTSPFGLPRSGLDIGAFRVTCEYSHMGFDDPVVKPNQPGASHLHTFFGNIGTTASSTPDSIADSGRSTCAGGTANRSAYWVPTLYDTRTGQPLAPSFAMMYYKTGYEGVRPDEVRPAPARLRIVAGSAAATAAQPHVSWGCLTSGGAVREPGSIPTDCAPGREALQLSVAFPQCWDGRNLDSPDHGSHMAHAHWYEDGCPSSHPVPLSQITVNVRYEVAEAGDSRHFRLSSDMYDAAKPGGLSLHADWMNGWDPQIQKVWVDHCNHKAMDCSNALGDGRELY